MGLDDALVPCPFCGASAAATCPGCGRDPTARRRACPHCQRMTPMAEAKCCWCGVSISSELPLKVIGIVVMFLVAFALSLALAFLR